MPATFTTPLVTAADGDLITADLWNNEFENLSTNFTPAGMDDYSASDGEMQTTTDPYPGSVVSRPTSLQGELERMRYVIAQITGETHWYQDPDASLASLQSAFVVVGEIRAYAGDSAPSGWMLCDGTAVSRTTYANLFAVVGTRFGQGDSATTFNIPDFRGRFLRGRDGGAGRDPDAASRTAMTTGGATGDNVGSVQDDATAKNGLALTDPGHTHSQHGNNSANAGTPGGGVATVMTAGFTRNVDPSSTGVTLGSGDSETRPLNATVNYLIKY